jgi:hypothetical protein
VAERTAQARERAVRRHLAKLGFTLAKLRATDRYVVTDVHGTREGLTGSLSAVELFLAELEVSGAMQARDRLAKS